VCHRRFIDYHEVRTNHPRPASAGSFATQGIALPRCAGRANVAPMLYSFLRTIVTVAVASLIVGTILAHFGLTGQVLLRELHIHAERPEAFLRHAFAWLLPNIALGAVVIIPVWCLAYLLRPSRQGRE
jgi:uncharacterized protein DUF6460